MAESACNASCNASACCCDARLKCLEKRVRWIRAGLLIALGVLLLLIGIGIGKGGDRRQAMRERAQGFVQRRGMMRGMGGPHMMMGGGMGPGAMGERMGPGPRGGRGADRGPGDEGDGPRDGDRRGGRNGN